VRLRAAAVVRLESALAHGGTPSSVNIVGQVGSARARPSNSARRPDSTVELSAVRGRLAAAGRAPHTARPRYGGGPCRVKRARSRPAASEPSSLRRQLLGFLHRHAATTCRLSTAAVRFAPRVTRSRVTVADRFLPTRKVPASTTAQCVDMSVDDPFSGRRRRFGRGRRWCRSPGWALEYSRLRPSNRHRPSSSHRRRSGAPIPWKTEPIS
jgi:hypothetical protein